MEDGAVRRPGILARLRGATANGSLGNRSFLLLSGGQLASIRGRPGPEQTVVKAN